MTAAPDVSALVSAAFDETPPADPQPERLASPTSRCVDGAPTDVHGCVLGAYRREMSPQQEQDERAREHAALMGAMAEARAACERMMMRRVIPRDARRTAEHRIGDALMMLPRLREPANRRELAAAVDAVERALKEA